MWSIKKIITGVVALGAATGLTLTLPNLDSTGGTDVAPTAPYIPVDQARHELAAVRVAPAGSMGGYDRDARFGDWAYQGDGCDTRDLVLKRQGTNVQVNEDCTVVSGTWHSLYEGRTLHDPDKLQVDHVVPAGLAWRSGADTWTDEQREHFANDYADGELLAVWASTNESKSDGGPATYAPVRAAQCAYATRFIHVLYTTGDYATRLTVTEPDKHALTDMLATCPTPKQQ